MLAIHRNQLGPSRPPVRPRSTGEMCGEILDMGLPTGTVYSTKSYGIVRAH
jgi:hypothetical protein